MSQERESQPNLWERTKADILRPPTKAEMIFAAICALDLAGVVSLGEVAKQTKDPLWHFGAGGLAFMSMGLAAMIAVDEFMYFFFGIDGDMRISGYLRNQE